MYLEKRGNIQNTVVAQVCRCVWSQCNCTSICDAVGHYMLGSLSSSQSALWSAENMR